MIMIKYIPSLGNQKNLRLLDLSGSIRIRRSSISLGSLSSPNIKLNETPCSKYSLRHQIVICTRVQTPNSKSSSMFHIQRVQRAKQTVSQYSERRLQNLPRQRNPLPLPVLGDGGIKVFNFGGEIELGATRAVGAGPTSGESAKIKLRPGRHVGDLREEGMESNADDGGAFG